MTHPAGGAAPTPHDPTGHPTWPRCAPGAPADPATAGRSAETRALPAVTGRTT